MYIRAPQQLLLCVVRSAVSSRKLFLPGLQTLTREKNKIINFKIQFSQSKGVKML